MFSNHVLAQGLTYADLENYHSRLKRPYDQDKNAVLDILSDLLKQGYLSNKIVIPPRDANGSGSTFQLINKLNPVNSEVVTVSMIESKIPSGQVIFRAQFQVTTADFSQYLKWKNDLDAIQGKFNSISRQPTITSYLSSGRLQVDLFPNYRLVTAPGSYVLDDRPVYKILLSTP